MTASDTNDQRFRLLSDVIFNNDAPDEKYAFIDGSRSVTYGEARDEIDSVGAYLVSSGFKPGERVAILYPNAWGFVRAVYSATKAGVIATVLHPRIAPGEIGRLMGITEPSALIADARLLNQVVDGFVPFAETLKLIAISDSTDKLRERIENVLGRGVVILEDELKSASPDRVTLPEIDPHSGALIIFTTGTTGPPKGVLLSHANILSVADAVVKAFSLTSDDITLVAATLAHVSSFTSQMVAYPMAGATVCIARGFFSMPREVLDFAQRWGVTSVHGMPTSLAMLINCMDEPEHGFPRLRYISLAGMRLTDRMLKIIKDRFPGVEIYNSYGLSEAAPRLTAFRVDTSPDKVGSVGQALPFCEVRITDSEGKFLAMGEVGEIVAKSPGCMLGYFNDEGSTEQTYIGEWLRTGDLGRLDEDGFIYVESRISEMINIAGEKVNPYEVEEAINSLEGVRASLVVKKPDDILGEVPIALVICEPGCTLTGDDILRGIKPMLSSFKMPMEIRFVDEFPMTASGKIARRLPEVM